MLVRERKPVRDCDRELDCAPRGQRSRPVDELLEVLAVDVLEDDELVPVGFATVDHRDDVRV